MTSRRKSTTATLVVTALALCVLSLPLKRGTAQAPKPDTPGKVEVAARDSADLAEGQALFRGLCSGCHGGAGRGGKGPDLTDNRWIHGSNDEDIARVIENGVPKTTMKKL